MATERRWRDEEARDSAAAESWRRGRAFGVFTIVAMASASSSSCSSRQRRRPSIPLIMCPLCGMKQILELTATTEDNRGRIFFTCPDHLKDGSGCDFWYWEEVYIKFLKRSGFIDEAACAVLLNEGKLKETEED